MKKKLILDAQDLNKIIQEKFGIKNFQIQFNLKTGWNMMNGNITIEYDE
jgi:hypothetical protein